MEFQLQYWVLQTLAMMITALLLPGLRVSGPFGALGMVIALALVNAHLWNAALFFQVPDGLTGQSIVLLLANGVLFWVLVKILPGIEIAGILPALLAPLVFTITSLLISHYGESIDWNKVAKVGIQKVSEVREYVSEMVPTPVPSPYNH